MKFKQATPEGGGGGGERKYSGIAVALNLLINILTEKGVQPPTAEQIKNNINIHNIGATKKAKQVFNVEANGMIISRSCNATQTKFKMSVLIKNTAFSPEDWEIFEACKYIIIYFKYNPFVD